MSTDSEKLDEQQTVETAPETAGDETTPQVDLAAELEKYKDLALRTRADLENYRKRAIREKEEAIRYANASLVESLVPIFDNFELGLGAARTATDPAGIIMGLDMVRKQLEDFLRDYGIEAVDAVGQPFDPNLHEAMAQEESDTVPEGTVLRQIRKGFKLKDRLIRPASVVVSKGPAQG